VTARYHRSRTPERKSDETDRDAEMTHSHVTVHLTNKNKALTKQEKISSVVEQARRILNDCNHMPDKITEHVFGQRLTSLELEYYFYDLDVSEAEIKAGSILNCIEDQLQKISLFVSDVCAENHQSSSDPSR
jgi:hypothetical protein